MSRYRAQLIVCLVALLAGAGNSLLRRYRQQGYIEPLVLLFSALFIAVVFGVVWLVMWARVRHEQRAEREQREQP